MSSGGLPSDRRTQREVVGSDGEAVTAETLHAPDDGKPAEATPGPPGRRVVRVARLAFRWPGSLRPSGQAGLAFLTYAAVTVGVFALPVITRLSSAYVGLGRNDAKLFAWSLAWWPHALVTGQDALFTNHIWAPAGTSLAFVTTIPGPSLVMWPVTRIGGTVFALNLLHLLAPPLAGWGAFLLCRRITGAFWPSLAGGYLFAFSTYMAVQLSLHPNLILVFPVPLAVYLVYRRVVDADIGPVAFVVLLTASLVGLFSIFTEIFATFAFFGVVTLLAAFAFARSDLRRRLAHATGLIAVAYLLTAAIVSPYLAASLRFLPDKPVGDVENASVDLLAFVVPRDATLVGGNDFVDLTRRFTAPWKDDGGYLGLPLVAAVVMFTVSQWRRRTTWFLASLAVVLVSASMGPMLYIAGRPIVPLPWSVVQELPLINNALPDRFPMYLSLVLGVMVALWLAARPRSWGRWALVIVAAAALVPDLSSPEYYRQARIPPFFEEGLYRRYLDRGEIVLVIPYGRGVGEADDMLWQAEADMYFRLTTGHTGFIPPGHRRPIVRCMRNNRPDLLDPQAFLHFVRSHRVRTVAVADGYLERWRGLLSRLAVRPLRVGGMTLYRLPEAGAVPSWEGGRGGGCKRLDASG